MGLITMKKIIRPIVILLVLLLFVGTFVFLWWQSRPTPTVYETVTPMLRDISKTTVITGKIEPRDEVNVKPQMSGIIAELLKEAGDRVEKGEVIARLKVIPDMNQLSSASSTKASSLPTSSRKRNKPTTSRAKRCWQLKTS